jgi:hypothetical protein
VNEAGLLDLLAVPVALDDPPHTAASWADDVHTCTYPLPVGPLVLRVNVADTDQRCRKQWGPLLLR